MKQVSTIGYEGASVGDFLATLLAAKIRTVVDVRELAISRRKGFSKNALIAELESAGIEYVHLRDLGDPKSGRTAAKEGRFSEFRQIYTKHLLSIKAQSALEELREIVASTNACLLCYERDPVQCHRTMVASALSDQELVRVVHLGVRLGVAHNVCSAGQQRASRSSSQSTAAAE